MDATKPEIKEAVEGLFDVKVKAVNTLNQRARSNVFAAVLGKRNDVKKAYRDPGRGPIHRRDHGPLSKQAEEESMALKNSSPQRRRAASWSRRPLGAGKASRSRS